MGLGVQLGQGERLVGIVGPMSQPRGSNNTASHALERTCAHGAFSEPTLLWAAKADL